MSQPFVRRRRSISAGTLGERFCYASGTAILALVLGSLLWALLTFRYGFGRVIPFDYVLYFTGAITLLAFALCENVIVEVFAVVIAAIFERDEQIPGWIVAVGLLGIVAAVVWIIYAV